MKARHVLAGFAIVLLAGCIEDPVSTDATDNAAMTVDRLFTHEGCSVYRFWDAGHLHYYTDCYVDNADDLSVNDDPNSTRYTLTEGPEFEALMQSAREALETPAYKNAMLKGDALRDILAYFGETP